MGIQIPCGLLLELMKGYLLLASLLFSSALQAQMGVPIANDIGSTTLKIKQLKSIFLGNTSIWPGGNTIIIVLPPSDSESFESIAQWAIESDGVEYQKHWLSIVFQGRAFAPVFLTDEEAIIDYVRTHPGSIGLLHSSTPPQDLTVQITE